MSLLAHLTYAEVLTFAAVFLAGLLIGLLVAARGRAVRIRRED